MKARLKPCGIIDQGLLASLPYIYECSFVPVQFDYIMDYSVDRIVPTVGMLFVYAVYSMCGCAQESSDLVTLLVSIITVCLIVTRFK